MFNAQDSTMAPSRIDKPAVKKREDVLTRISPQALEDAKLAAQYRGMTLLEYLSKIVKEAADRDIEEGHALRAKAKAKR